jgi:GMP synthase-like glutamine amidotransferase
MPQDTAPPAMHLGLLKVDWVNDEFLPRHGDLPDIFSKFFKAQAHVVVDTFDVLQGALPPVGYSCDAFVITGSRFCAYEDNPVFAPLARFMGQTLEREEKVVGFCFGHQFLAHILGGRVERSPRGWNVGLRPLEFREYLPWMSPSHESLTLLFNHHDHVVDPPVGARVLAGAAECPVQMFCLGSSCLGLQPHPEYTIEYQEALMKAASGMPADVFTEAVERNRSLQNDSARMLRWILQFIRGVPLEQEVFEPQPEVVTP